MTRVCFILLVMVTAAGIMLVGCAWQVAEAPTLPPAPEQIPIATPSSTPTPTSTPAPTLPPAPEQIPIAVLSSTPTPVPTPAPAMTPVVEVPAVLGKQGMNLSSYDKIDLGGNSIEVSSFNDPTWENKESLVDSNPETYWHAKFPKETDEAWVVVDLGNERQLTVLAVSPRTGHLDQLWKSDAAVLEGSCDKNEWTAQVKLALDHEELNDQDWIAFVFPETVGFRYYRLFITHPQFLSLGGLEVYGGAVTYKGMARIEWVSSYRAGKIKYYDYLVSYGVLVLNLPEAQATAWAAARASP